MEILNTEMTSSHFYTGFKIMSILNTTMEYSHIQKQVSVLGYFFSTYFWKDFTFLALNTQKEFKAFSQNLCTTAVNDPRFSSSYCELLIFSEDGLLEEDTITGLNEIPDPANLKEVPRLIGSMKVTVSVLIFNTYLYEIYLQTDSILKKLDQTNGSESMSIKTNPSSKLKKEIHEFSNNLGKTTRFVKYILSLLELTACKKQRRKEIVLRVHFDFFYLAYLSFLFGLEDKTQNTPLNDLIRTHLLQALTFLLVLIEVTDSKEKNFTTIVKMRRQRFSVQCDSLAYKMAIEFLLIGDKPIWELEAFDIKKV
jgi:hypothetical protein